MHAKAAREGRGGARGGRGGGGRINERDEADPEPQAVPVSYGRGGVRAPRGRAGRLEPGQMVTSAPVVAVGGQLRPQGRGGRDAEYDRGMTGPDRRGYPGADFGGGRGGVRDSVRAAPPVRSDMNSGMPQRGRGRGGSMVGSSMGAGRVAAPGMVRQPQQQMREVNDEYDDPNDPFPALTKSHPGNHLSNNDQTVTVNIRGLGGRGPLQRSALEGTEDDDASTLTMPKANAGRPGGRRARVLGEQGLVPGTSITPSHAMAPHFTPTSSLNMGNNMSNPMPMVSGPGQQQQQAQQVSARAMRIRCSLTHTNATRRVSQGLQE